MDGQERARERAKQDARKREFKRFLMSKLTPVSQIPAERVRESFRALERGNTYGYREEPDPEERWYRIVE